MFIWGKLKNESQDFPRLKPFWDEAQILQRELVDIPLAQIIDLCHSWGELWMDEKSELFKKALEGLKADVSFSEEMITQTLRLIPSLFSREALHQRVNTEFHDPNALDDFSSRSFQPSAIRAYPVGPVLHVTAGNVFLSFLDSLLMGFLTKNISVIKVSSRNQFFPLYCAESLADHFKQSMLGKSFSILSWKGGSPESLEIEQFFKRHCRRIIAWGGEEMIQAYSQGLPLGHKLIDYGPKISFQVVSQLGWREWGGESLVKKLAHDLVLWDQQACSSPQNCFVEKGVDVKLLIESLARELAEGHYPARGKISADEQVEILKEKERAQISFHLDGLSVQQGADFLLHEEKKRGLRVSPLNRVLVFKTYESLADLKQQIEFARFYLQSSGICVGTEEMSDYYAALIECGVKRLTAIGKMGESSGGLPHDGRWSLNDFVEFVGLEEASALREEKFLKSVVAKVPYYQKWFAEQPETTKIKLEDFPLSSGDLISLFNPQHSRELLADDAFLKGGRFFASGGSSGEPKSVFYANHEWEQTAEFMGHNLKAQGLQPGTVALNVFAAGHLYSSFLAVDRMCEKFGFIQLPLSAHASVDEVLETIQKFKPQLIFGLPSLLVTYALEAQKRQLEMVVSHVLYAGEHLTPSAQKFLQEVWKTKYFSSAGYASVDAGVIGYQCQHCPPGVHHLYEPWVNLEIHDGEAVVTNFVRQAMPVIRYKMGDRVELIKQTCACGAQGTLFKLLGRVDRQFNLWSCRLHLSAMEHALETQLNSQPDFQIQLFTKGPIEKLLVLVSDPEKKISKREQSLLEEQIFSTFYELSPDLQKTRSLAEVRLWFEVKWGEENEFLFHPRTGKKMLIHDARVNF
jgi:phenylacetate-CoA ligase